ncbi:MAG: ribosome silencing factor [Bacteroidetes bacterium]|nr:ribosome silencing factor [Bacteroidota bacterium]
MAKIPVKKAAAKKTTKPAVAKKETSKTAPAKKVVAKKTVKAKLGFAAAVKKKSSKAKIPAKKVIKKKVITPEEREFREANLIANSENKKKTGSSTKRPKKSSTPKETTSLLDAIVEGMEDRKAKNITILNISKLDNRVTDYFVICDADSKTHVNSIADSVEDMVIKLTNEKAYHAEGHQNSEWILIDYINIVVHVFLRETREFYNIEGLWGDAEITTIN